MTRWPVIRGLHLDGDDDDRGDNDGDDNDSGDDYDDGGGDVRIGHGVKQQVSSNC